MGRVAYRNKLRKIIVCQSAIRRFLARRRYKKLKAEARTISHMQKMYKGLENKIISLQQRIDEIHKDNVQLRQRNNEIPELKTKLEAMRLLEVEMKALRIKLLERETIVADVRRQLEMERDEKMSLLEEKHLEEEEWKRERAAMKAESEQLRTKVDEIVENAKNDATGNIISLFVKVLTAAIIKLKIFCFPQYRCKDRVLCRK